MRNTISTVYITFGVIYITSFAIIETRDKISDRAWGRLFTRIKSGNKDKYS